MFYEFHGFVHGLCDCRNSASAALENLAAGTALCNSDSLPALFCAVHCRNSHADLFEKIESQKSRNIAGAFENRVGDFLGWISFPLYLVRAAVIYSFSVRGLDALVSLGLEPSAQWWLIGIATVPVAIVFAILFCPVNDFAVTLLRRFGVALFGGREARPYTGLKSRPA